MKDREYDELCDMLYRVSQGYDTVVIISAAIEMAAQALASIDKSDNREQLVAAAKELLPHRVDMLDGAEI